MNASVIGTSRTERASPILLRTLKDCRRRRAESRRVLHPAECLLPARLLDCLTGGVRSASAPCRLASRCSQSLGDLRLTGSCSPWPRTFPPETGLQPPNVGRSRLVPAAPLSAGPPGHPGQPCRKPWGHSPPPRDCKLPATPGLSWEPMNSVMAQMSAAHGLPAGRACDQWISWTSPETTTGVKQRLRKRSERTRGGLRGRRNCQSLNQTCHPHRLLGADGQRDRRPPRAKQPWTASGGDTAPAMSGRSVEHSHSGSGKAKHAAPAVIQPSRESGWREARTVQPPPGDIQGR
jgi:hypothetical protein